MHPWSYKTLAIISLIRQGISYSCSQSDQTLLGSNFGSDYWTCIEKTNRMDQLETCVTSIHPNVDSVSTSCANCIYNVFLMNGANCVIDCRSRSDSPDCVTCKQYVRNQWNRQCSPSGANTFTITIIAWLSLYAFW